MIKVDSIEIHALRGIKSLHLDFARDNYAICGKNGTGKSGVVDALEFGLTGNMARLNGPGTGSISLKTHGPHVDSSDKPEDARVRLEVFLPSLNQTAIVERCVKSPSKPTIVPDNTEIRTVLGEVAAHPEFALSRREIIRYILTEPGTRSKEVSALLKLDKLEKTRSVLLKIRNAEDRIARQVDAQRKDARAKLQAALKIQEVNVSTVSEAANSLRSDLGLEPILELKADTDLTTGLISEDVETAPPSVSKSVAKSDIAAARELIEKLQGDEFENQSDHASELIDELIKNKDASIAAEKENLLKSSLEIFDGLLCPVCDTEWDDQEFRALLDQKIEAMQEVSKERAALEKNLKPIAEICDVMASSLKVLSTYAQRLIPDESEGLKESSVELGDRGKKIRELFPLQDTLAAITALRSDNSELTASIEKVEKEVGELPEPSKQDAAKLALSVAQERLESLRACSRQFTVSVERLRIASVVYDMFAEVMTEQLSDTFSSVEKRFSELYGMVNNDDEAGFSASLSPKSGKLDLEVDFYGRGQFPPSAYHSEGHQDTMGICLYLALMEKLQGGQFLFAVLDDVLMSIDKIHRREISKMLVKEFPETQFVFTTHDEVWLRHMKSEGLVGSKNVANFRRWTVELGPASWESEDVWKELDELVSSDQIPKAAAVLRHFLEHFAREASVRLRATVEYRGEDNFALGDLLPPAISAMKKAYKATKNAEQSWGNDVAELSAKADEFDEIVSNTQVEQWQLNAAVHFNNWHDLGKEDFEPLVSAFKDLVDHLRCSNCNAMLYVTPDYGSKELVRCACQAVALNLVAK